MIRMMMLLALTLLPGLAAAQTVALRTGEHRDFTRIVAFVPDGADWNVGRNADGYVLRVDDVDGYDLSGFFDLIPRTRVLDAAEGAAPSDLQLFVTCPCNIRAWRLRPGIVVVDVRDGLPNRITPFELALPDLDAPPGGPRFVLAPQRPRYQVSGNQLLPLIPEVGGGPVPQADPADTVPSTVTPPQSTVDVAAFAEVITESLAQGLADGALDPARPPLAADDADGFARLKDALDSLPGVRARTGADPLAVPTRAPTGLTQEGDACLPDRYFDLPAWGSDAPFHKQIATARRAVVTETGMIDEDAVETLAKRYLYFGFGREAAQALALDGAISRERQYLHLIAAVVDGEPATPELLAGQVSCAGPVALWALLAQTAPPVDAKTDRDAVLVAFRALPPAVKDAVATRLSSRFLQIGDTDAAVQVLNPDIELSAPDPETALAAADVVTALGEPDKAQEAVAAVVRTDPRASPAAMTRFLQEAVAGDRAVTDDDFLLAESLRFQNAGSDEVVALAAAEMRALLAMDRFAQALDLYRDEAAAFSPEVATSLQTALWTAVSDRASDARFLQLVWPTDPDALTVVAQDAIAARMLAVGFAEEAARFVAGPVEPEAAAARAILRSQIALGREDPAAALAVLAPFAGAEVTALRDAARAMERRLTPDTPLVPRDQPAVLPLTQEAPLRESRALLQQSAQSRAAVEALLQTSEIPADVN